MSLFDPSPPLATGTGMRGPVVVSACLVGFPTAYNGTHRRRPGLPALLRQLGGIALCPEQLGGLGTPRPAAEIVGGDGQAVLNGGAMVLSRCGRAVTDEFLHGARLSVQAALKRGAGAAILQDGSPSCGATAIYDGTFTGCRRAGLGVAAACLQSHGVELWSLDERDGKLKKRMSGQEG